MKTEFWILIIVGPAGLFALVRHIVSEWRASRREVAEIQRQQTEHLFEMRSMAEASFEQGARRDRRKRRESSSPPSVRARPMPVPTGEFELAETTDVYAIREEKRLELAKPRGLREPRRGTHHDKER